MPSDDPVQEFVEGFEVGHSPDDAVVDILVDRYVGSGGYSLLDHDSFAALPDNHRAAWFVLVYHAYGALTHRIAGLFALFNEDMTPVVGSQNVERVNAQQDLHPAHMLTLDDLEVVEEAFEGSDLVLALQDTDDMTRFVAPLRERSKKIRAQGPQILGDPPPDWDPE